MVELVIEARVRDVDGFAVRRLLPAPLRRMVGPFIFFDHMGPTALPPGHGMAVRPHPHIGLATVTYLFDGEIVHRDSLGSAQPIRPGDVNWMIAGRGIVHSERATPERRASGGGMHGLQLWVALPEERETGEPEFHHHAGSSLPSLDGEGIQLRLLAGTGFGMTSPVRTHSPLVYADAALAAGARLVIPAEHDERAIYVVEGELTCGATTAHAGQMLVLLAGQEISVTAHTATRLVLVGGKQLAGPRYIWWNFVSSSRERLEAAKADWKARRFPAIPGDDVEFIPLPPEVGAPVDANAGMR